MNWEGTKIANEILDIKLHSNVYSVQGRAKCKRSGMFLGPDTEEGRRRSFDPCPWLISVLEVIAQMLGCSTTFPKRERGRLQRCPRESAGAGASWRCRPRNTNAGKEISDVNSPLRWTICWQKQCEQLLISESKCFTSQALACLYKVTFCLSS